MSNELVFGIDLGTTNSVIAVFSEEERRANVVPNAEGEQITPSVVALVDNEVLVGSSAKRMAAAYPDQTAVGFKRLIGLHTDDGRSLDCLAYDGKTYTPEVLSSLILNKVASDASDYLGVKVKKVVITVPAYFEDSARKATQNAGQIAGLDVVSIINEPTAGAIAYGYGSETEGHVAAYDLGGGTFDISIIRIQDKNYTVLSTDGDRALGGDDFTNKIIEFALEAFEAANGFRLTVDEDPNAMVDLIERAERAKIDLSTRKKTVIVASARGKELRVELSREQFESLILPMVNTTLQLFDKCVQESGISRDSLSVILVGGSTRVPLVPRLIEERLGLTPIKARVEPDLAVAKGAAIVGASGKIVEGSAGGALADVTLQDVCSHGLGVEVVQNANQKVVSTIIPRNSPLPVQRTEKFALERDVQTTARINVFQGQDGIPTDQAEFIGKIVLRGLPIKLPRENRIEVTLAYDTDGIVHVTAEDVVSGKSTNGRLEHQRGFTQNEIEQARKEVEGLLAKATQ